MRANKISLQKILAGLPKDFVRNAVRDISMPTAAVFVDIHHTQLPKLFGCKFTAVFLYLHGKLAGIYRSPKEYDAFAEKLARKFLAKPAHAINVVSKLKKYTDRLNGFIKENTKPADFINNRERFFQTYHEFFAYHQATQFSGNYLSKIPLPKSKQRTVKKLVRLLAGAYQYNEMVVPNLEKYFAKLRVTEFLPEEIGIIPLKKIEKDRSVISFKNSRYLLSQVQAAELSHKIENRLRKQLANARLVLGNPVNRGKYIGKVKLITNLNKLDNLKKGQVLVTTMTRPQYNNILRYAGAIVTDEGGVVDHAAILAREFGLPCVSGTKIATQVFKTGDLVEVDAERGIVKKLVK